MNKLVTLVSAAAMMGAVGAAQAATYDTVGGSGTVVTTSPGALGPFPIPVGTEIGASSITGGSGSSTGAGAAFSAAITLNQNVTSPLDASVNGDITWDWTLSGDGTGTKTATACTGSATVCDEVAIGDTLNVTLSAFDFSDVNNISWQTQTPGFTAALGANNNNIEDYTASGAPEVPLPAAAWLFGSGLIGLAGVARRRQQ